MRRIALALAVGIGLGTSFWVGQAFQPAPTIVTVPAAASTPPNAVSGATITVDPDKTATTSVAFEYPCPAHPAEDCYAILILSEEGLVGVDWRGDAEVERELNQ